ncbi:MAG: hypothetical protein WC380_00070 [Pedobacter sp.]|jgi:hypothetical protein
MKKSEREIIFNKYGGKCAYCGCNLAKGWHVDHLEPCQRKTKWVRGHWSNPDGHRMTEQELLMNGVKWVEDKLVQDGFYNPDANHIDNYNPSCASCNILKSSVSIESFRERIAAFIHSLNSYTNQYKFAKRYGLVKETGKQVIFYFETLTP